MWRKITYIILPYLLAVFLSCAFVLNSFSQEYKNEVQEHLKAVESLNKETNKSEISGYYSKVAYLYWENEEHNSAVEYFLKVLDLNIQIGNKNAIGIIYRNIGLIYTETEEYNKAIEYYNKSYDFNKETKNTRGQAEDLINISQANTELNSLDEAIKFAELSLGIYTELNNVKGLRKCYGTLAEIYEKKGDTEKSFDYFNLYSTVEKHIQKEVIKEKEKETKEQIDKIKHESDVTIKEKEEQVVLLDSSLKFEIKEGMLKDETITKLNITTKRDQIIKGEQARKLKKAAEVRNYLLLVLLSILIVSFFLYRGYIIKKRTNAQLASQNAEILRQQEVIAEKNLSIERSIGYAKRIQKALLPQQEGFQNYFNDSFIYFKPRDVVSGDFYWFSDTNLRTLMKMPDEKDSKDQGNQNNKSNDVIVAAIDCTGHGVPGAFMSMIGYNLINEIVSRGINRADKILNVLHRGVRNALKQDVTENRDGMDLSLCVIRKKKKIVEFAGAKNPIIYIQDGKLVEIKGDRYQIGGLQRHESERKFTLRQVKVDKPTYFYIFSDGYEDQIGGEKGKKFMPKQFRKLLLEIYQLPNEEKIRILDARLQEWIGDDFPQVDDILIMGFALTPEDFEN